MLNDEGIEIKEKINDTDLNDDRITTQQLQYNPDFDHADDTDTQSNI